MAAIIVQKMTAAKRLGKIRCVLALMLALFVSAQAQVVHFADPNLQRAVRMALHKPVGPITVADMKSLVELNASAEKG